MEKNHVFVIDCDARGFVTVCDTHGLFMCFLAQIHLRSIVLVSKQAFVSLSHYDLCFVEVGAHDGLISYVILVSIFVL